MRRSALSALTPLLLAATLPWVLAGSRDVDCNTSGLVQWLPDRDSERNRYQAFLKDFGADDMVLVTWPGCTLAEPRLEQLAVGLMRASEAGSRDAEDRLFEEVVTGQRLLARLTSPPLSLGRREAVRRLSGFVVGPDEETTCAIVKLARGGQDRPKRVIQAIERVAVEECGLRADELRLGGSAYEAFVMDAESERCLRGYTLQAAAVTLLVAAICLRSLRLIVAVGLAAAYGRLLVMAMVYSTGAHFTAVLIVAPALVYVLTVSGGVHLANYYQDALCAHGWRGSGWRALRMGWRPCCLAAVTTAIGLVSLGVSQIAPIREFGYYSAGCLMLALVIMLLLIPSVLELWPPRGGAGPRLDAPAGSLRAWLTQRLPDFAIRHHRAVLLAGGALLLATGYGLRYTQTTVTIQGMFRSDTELIRNYRWIEERIGPLGTIEVIVHFGAACPLDVLDRAGLVSRMERSIRRIDEVSATVSPATFLPSIPESGGARGAARRAVYRRRLEDQRSVLVEERFVAPAAGGELWRITARVATLPTPDYARLARKVLGAIDGTLAGTQGESVSAGYTGLLPMIETAQRLLLGDLLKSFAMAVALICPVMMLVVGDVRAGALAMIPNVAPLVIVFGAMGWWGQKVDVGSVLTAGVALGIAVDDTLHFLQWHGRAVREGLTRQEAIREAFRRCAPAMVQTTLICCVGLLVLVESAFIPAVRFSVLVFFLLALALPGDLVLLPAILASPLGACFARAAHGASPPAERRPAAAPEP